MKTLPKIAAVAAVALLVLSGCGKSDDSKSSSSDSKSSSSSSSDAKCYPDAGSKEAAATGTAMTGTGYTYSLPQGWDDITAELKKTQPGIDSGGRAAATPPFTANMNVLTTPSKSTGDLCKGGLDELDKQIKSEIVSLAPQIKTFPHTKVDGSPAVHQEGSATSSGATFYLVQYFVVHKGNNYGITFAFPTATSEADRNKTVGSVLNSFKFA